MEGLGFRTCGNMRGDGEGVGEGKGAIEEVLEEVPPPLAEGKGAMARKIESSRNGATIFNARAN